MDSSHVFNDACTIHDIELNIGEMECTHMTRGTISLANDKGCNARGALRWIKYKRELRYDHEKHP